MENILSNKTARAYTEILEIIKNLDNESANKIPKKLINFFEENKDKNYKFQLDDSKPLEEQELSEETGGLLAVLALNYFSSEEEKEKIKEKLIENENKYQEQLNERYNPNNLFKSKNQECKKEEVDINNNDSNMNLIIANSIPWYKKIWLKIKGVFSK